MNFRSRRKMLFCAKNNKGKDFDKNSIYSVISNRRSIRKFKTEKISEDTVRDILIAGTLAPSAKNRQPWYFSILRESKKDQIANLMMEYASSAEREEYEIQGCKSSVYATAKVILEAPVLILIFKNIDDNWLIGDLLSIGACVQNMLLYATQIGLGSLWIRDTYCVAEEASKWFCDGKKELCCAVAIGKAAEFPCKRPRKKLSDIMCEFGGSLQQES